MTKEDLYTIFTTTPEKIFTLQLGVLDYYFKYATRQHRGDQR